MRILASHLSIVSAPFEVGVASDPMSHRRGGRPLPMEDVCLAEWPLRGAHEVCLMLLLGLSITIVIFSCQ